jgi:hypothetical protein
MRSDLTQYGVEEARTPEDVDRLLGPKSGTVLMVVNSVCGCAAGRARPAIGLALRHPVHMLHRSDIERRDPWAIAELLKEAFERFCAPSLSVSGN